MSPMTAYHPNTILRQGEPAKFTRPHVVFFTHHQQQER
jgi:hypothetical protein